jgi:RNA polymerase sigma-70 factor (family 1)
MEKQGLPCICDETVFAGFFKTHVKNLRNYLYYKFGNEEQAGDIAQEAFIKLWENCKNVPLEKAKSFLYIVANNASLNFIAHQKVVLEHAKKADPTKHSFESPDYLIEEEEFRVKLHNAIERLSEAQRTAFLLNRIDGKKYSEIAEMLGISVKAVEKRISGALVYLRENIDQFQGMRI